MLSQRVKNIAPSATLSITAKAQSLKAKGIPVISLSSGEPDFATPDLVKQAAIDAINNNFSHYTPVDGLPSLKDAIIHKLERDNSLYYQSNQILVSCGAKHSLYNLTQAILEPGDEAIIPAPYWVSYYDMVKLTGAEPVVLHTKEEDHFRLNADALEAAITPKTKLLFLNMPSNPTGQSYDEISLNELARVLRKHPHVQIVSDDIYEHILWGQEKFLNIVNVEPSLQDRTIIVNGVSKAYAMTGWRIGFAAGNAQVIGAMKKLQSQSTSNSTAISQKAAEAAFMADLSMIKPMCEAFKKRHDLLVNGINQINHISCLQAQGTFYAFVNVMKLLEAKGLSSDIELGEKWLDEIQIAAVPGSAFGAPGYMRLSFATHENDLNESLERLHTFCR